MGYYKDKTEQDVCIKVANRLKDRFPDITPEKIAKMKSELDDAMIPFLSNRRHVKLPYIGRFIHRFDIEELHDDYRALRQQGKTKEEIKEVLTYEMFQAIRAKHGFLSYKCQRFTPTVIINNQDDGGQDFQNQSD